MFWDNKTKYWGAMQKTPFMCLHNNFAIKLFRKSKYWLDIHSRSSLCSQYVSGSPFCSCSHARSESFKFCTGNFPMKIHTIMSNIRYIENVNFRVSYTSTSIRTDIQVGHQFIQKCISCRIMPSIWQRTIFSSTPMKKVWERTFIGKVARQDSLLQQMRMEIYYH